MLQAPLADMLKEQRMYVLYEIKRLEERANIVTLESSAIDLSKEAAKQLDIKNEKIIKEHIIV